MTSAPSDRSPSGAAGFDTSALLDRLPGVQAFDLEVTGAQMLTPAMRRLELSAGGLATLDAQPGQDLTVAVPDGGRIFRRRYTIRYLDRERGVVALDVVLHGDGPGARWATAARPGDRVEAIGPRGRITLAAGAAWHLFAGDDSAIPATFAMIEALPPTSSAVALLEVAGPEDEQAPVDPRCELHLQWRYRTGAPGTGTGLAGGLRGVDLPAGAGHAYLAGELHQVAAARSVLLERGMASADVDHKAYWRLGVANAAHGEPERPAATR